MNPSMSDLTLRESSAKSERDLIACKLTNSLKDNAILTKQLEQWKIEHGELLLAKCETDHQLTESHQECERLREKMVRASQELQRLKSEKNEAELKCRNFSQDVDVLKKQCRNLSEENSDLAAELLRLKSERDETEYKCRNLSEDVDVLNKQCRKLSEENSDLMAELKGLKEQIMAVEEEKGEVLRREKEAVGRCRKLLDDLEVAEKQRKENSELLSKNKKLERNLDVVMDAATKRFRLLNDRLSSLEANVALLNNDSSTPSGQKLDETTHVKEKLEGSWSDAKLGGFVGSPSVCETTTFEEKTASSMPCIDKSALPSPPVFDISDSDDDDKLPLSNILKRKLSSSEVSNEGKDGANCSKHRSKELKGLSHESVNHFPASASSLESKPDLKLNSPAKLNPAALKQCEKKVEMESDGKHHGPFGSSVVIDGPDDIQGESGNLKKEWEYEADMLDALGTNTELCMKAICALYRQHTTLGRSSAATLAYGHGGFSKIFAFRGFALGKFLMDGDAEGGMKRSLADLEKFDPEGAEECRRIAFGHSKQLFHLYQSRDPFFTT